MTLTWEHVANPQPSGYEIQIAKDSAFQTIEVDDPQLNGPTREILSLTAGRKFWRVRSAQGDASPTTAALTAWSAAGTFTISSAPPTPVSVTLAKDPLYSGEMTWVAVQLTAAAPAGGATINMSSSNPGAMPVPATITMPGNTAWMQFQVQAGQVTVPTPVTLTAALNAASASAQFTLQPPSLRSLTISPSDHQRRRAAAGHRDVQRPGPCGRSRRESLKQLTVSEPAFVGACRGRQLLRLVPDLDERGHEQHHRHSHGELRGRVRPGASHADAPAAAFIADA